MIDAVRICGVDDDDHFFPGGAVWFIHGSGELVGEFHAELGSGGFGGVHGAGDEENDLAIFDCFPFFLFCSVSGIGEDGGIGFDFFEVGQILCTGHDGDEEVSVFGGGSGFQGDRVGTFGPEFLVVGTDFIPVCEFKIPADGSAEMFSGGGDGLSDGGGAGVQGEQDDEKGGLQEGCGSIPEPLEFQGRVIAFGHGGCDARVELRGGGWILLPMAGKDAGSRPESGLNLPSRFRLR